MSGGIAQLAEPVIWYNEDSASPMTVARPAAFGAGDLLVFVIAQDGGLLSDITAPGGWTPEENPVDGTGQRAKVMSHVYDGTEPSTWDFGYNSGSSVAAGLFRIAGANQTPNVVVTSRYSGSNSATEDSPTVPPTGNSDLLLSVVTHSGGAAAFSATDPSAMTDAGQTQYADLYQTVAAAWQSLTSDGPTGVRTWTSVSGTGRQLGAFSIAIHSSDAFDPDPPLKPPAPELPPRLLRALLAAKARELVGHQNTPIFKFPPVSGGAASVNIVLTTPAPCDTTDLLVAFHGNNWFTAAEMLTPSPGTWAERALGDNGPNSVHQKIWTAKVTTPGIQTVTFAPAQDEEHTAHLAVVSGVDPDDFIDGTPAGSNGAASTSHIAPATNPATPNPLLLYGAMSATESNYSIPAGAINNGAKIVSEADVASFCTGAVACQELATSGTTGTRTLTSSANAIWATATIAIKAGTPAVEGGPALSGAADTAQHTTTDSTAVKAAAADAPTTQRTATTSLRRQEHRRGHHHNPAVGNRRHHPKTGHRPRRIRGPRRRRNHRSRRHPQRARHRHPAHHHKSHHHQGRHRNRQHQRTHHHSGHRPETDHRPHHHPPTHHEHHNRQQTGHRERDLHHPPDNPRHHHRHPRRNSRRHRTPRRRRHRHGRTNRNSTSPPTPRHHFGRPAGHHRRRPRHHPHHHHLHRHPHHHRPSPRHPPPGHHQQRPSGARLHPRTHRRRSRHRRRRPTRRPHHSRHHRSHHHSQHHGLMANPPGDPRNGHRYRQAVAATLAASDICHLCGHSDARTADHIIPIHDWPPGQPGVNHPDNLAPAHGSGAPTPNPCPTCARMCNQARGARTITPEPRSRDW